MVKNFWDVESMHMDIVKIYWFPHNLLRIGQADLTSLYGLIANNFSWLEHQFDIQFVLPPYVTEDNPQFTLRMDVQHVGAFDACKEYEMIGSRKFDHVCLFYICTLYLVVYL